MFRNFYSTFCKYSNASQLPPPRLNSGSTSKLKFHPNNCSVYSFYMIKFFPLMQSRTKLMNFSPNVDLQLFSNWSKLLQRYEIFQFKVHKVPIYRAKSF